MTKGQALVKSMVGAALSGDQRMLANILKLMENAPKAAEDAPSPAAAVALNDWLELFMFYGKYKKLIEGEIRRLKKENPDYWSFDWFKPTLKSAPWYQDLYGQKTRGKTSPAPHDHRTPTPKP